MKISTENKELLEKKKRRLGLKSLDKVISVLLEKQEKSSSVHITEKKQEQAQDVPIEKPRLELPSSKGNKEKCLFRAEKEIGKIQCAKDFAETDVIHIKTIEYCNECWTNAFHIN
ncbi:hypothetical protein MUP46_04610 [Patescibacteria group bacterium]|nr:hypothetical protein [Patescibacteria group bacterium]